MAKITLCMDITGEKIILARVVKKLNNSLLETTGEDEQDVTQKAVSAVIHLMDNRCKQEKRDTLTFEIPNVAKITCTPFLKDEERERLTNYQFLKRANNAVDVIHYLSRWDKFIVQFKLEKPLFAALKACEDAETMALFLTESPLLTGFPIYEDCLEWLNSPYCKDGYPYEDDGEE